MPNTVNFTFCSYHTLHDRTKAAGNICLIKARGQSKLLCLTFRTRCSPLTAPANPEHVWVHTYSPMGLSWGLATIPPMALSAPRPAALSGRGDSCSALSWCWALSRASSKASRGLSRQLQKLNRPLDKFHPWDPPRLLRGEEMCDWKHIYLYTHALRQDL